MRTRSLLFVFAVMLALQAPSKALAEKILLISSGDAANDVEIQSVLQAAGDTVTIGPTYSNFTGTGLSGYNAVFLNPSYDSTSQATMPVAGQQALVNYVNQGGGLVVGGMALVQSVMNQGAYQTLDSILPNTLSNTTTANSPITFTSLSANSVMNTGLPSLFSFPASGYWTETLITPKTNATAFFATDQWTSAYGGPQGFGSIGWNFGSGRVLSLSTFSDPTALGSTTYDQMLSNSVQWAAQASGAPPIINPNPPNPPPISVHPPAVPEPGSLLVFGMAGVGFAILLSRRGSRSSS
jgi:hypothetical protein